MEEALWSATVKAANALQTRTCEELARKVASLTAQQQHPLVGEDDQGGLERLLRLNLTASVGSGDEAERGSMDIDGEHRSASGDGIVQSQEDRDALSLAREVLERVQQGGTSLSLSSPTTADVSGVEFQVRNRSPL